MTQVYIGLGSNLESPLQQVLNATEQLKTLPLSQVLNASSCYLSSPMGPIDQPDYINRVVLLETDLLPLQLLNALQALEKQQGRIQKERWGARVIDLDILLYGNEIIVSELLMIPHEGIGQRSFVLYPLAEIAPDLLFPNGDSILYLKAQCSDADLIKIKT